MDIRISNILLVYFSMSDLTLKIYTQLLKLTNSKNTHKPNNINTL